MSIPLATTTISVLRWPDDDPDDPRDPYDTPPDRVTVASGVRARIGQPSSSEQVAGGTQSLLGLRVWCDPITVGLQATDLIVDEETGDTYELDGPGFHQRGLGLDHLVAPVKQVQGVT